MTQNLKIIIDGYEVKELRCKNDICRKLIGYENIKVGVFIYVCPVCENISIFNMKYKEVAKAFITSLEQKFKKEGG